MLKKNLRILSLALAIILMVGIIPPVKAEAVPTTAAQVASQIKDTYKKAKRYLGIKSFDGYCGAYTSAQLYVMGITAVLEGGDGNQQYNVFSRMKLTSGGYRVKAYPASGYTLKEALNTISKNGTRNVYNILVGYEKTRSAAGQRYGHATVIHAILNGTVYFSESYNVNYKGKSYAEGVCVGLSIDDFCDYYSITTTQLDGVIHFGLKTYAEQCTAYNASFLGETAVEAQIWSQPCTTEVHETAEVLRTAGAGEQLVITGLYKNTEGEYWYQIDDESCYIRADQVKKGSLITDDVRLVNLKTPTSLRQGRSYNITGYAVSRFSAISTLRAQVYQITEEGMTSVLTATASVNSKSYNLKNSRIAKDLTFRKLAVGQYRLEFAAIVSIYYVENGQLVQDWETVTLWMTDFQVTKSTTSSDTIVFDACGGVSSLNQVTVSVGKTVGYLPIAQRLDHVFLGWYTEAEGGERVDEDFAPSDDTTLYARWTSVALLNSAWEENAECWYYYSDGTITMGCIQLDGILYYFSTVDPMDPDAIMWTATAAIEE